MFANFVFWLFASFLAVLSSASIAVGYTDQTASWSLFGTTLSGAEFGAQNMPGTYGKDFIYPNASEVDYFIGQKHMTVIRLPFLWERMQHAQFAGLDSAELSRMDAFVSYATTHGATVILDPHNYARYFGSVIGSAAVSYGAFADFWTKLSAHYAANSRVVFALMNEPHDLPTEQWATAAQIALSAIRLVGARNLVLIPGVSWTGAWSWSRNYYGTPNSVAMLSVQDTANNMAFEVHQYFDADYSGTQSICQSGSIGSESLAGFTAWLRANHKRGFLGEFGAAANSVCLAAVADTLSFLKANSDVYIGWSWWAAGPWWGNYFMSIEPGNWAEEPMLDLLEGSL